MSRLTLVEVQGIAKHHGLNIERNSRRTYDIWQRCPYDSGVTAEVKNLEEALDEIFQWNYQDRKCNCYPHFTALKTAVDTVDGDQTKLPEPKEESHGEITIT